MSWLHAVFGWVLAEADKRDLLGGQGVQKRRAGESFTLLVGCTWR